MFYPNYETILIKYIQVDFHLPFFLSTVLFFNAAISNAHMRAQLSRNGIYLLPRYDNGPS